LYGIDTLLVMLCFQLVGLCLMVFFPDDKRG
jgi:hypothetical protein